MSRKVQRSTTRLMSTLLFLNLLIFTVTKIICVFVYHIVWPFLAAYLAVFYFLRQNKRWAVWCYHFLTAFSLFLTVLFMLQIRNKMRWPDTASPKYLLGGCYTAMALIHLITSVSLCLTRRKKRSKA